MGGKYLKDDFEFPASFGFSGSASGNANPRSHPTQDGDEFGDGTYLAAKSAAEPALARGGRVPRPHGMPGAGNAIPVPKVAKAVAGALQVGKAIGQKMASAAPQGALGAAAAPMGAPAIQPGMPPAMRKGGRIRNYAEGGAVRDSDASAAEAAAHEQTVPGNMDSASPAQSDAEILRAHGYAGGGKVHMASGGSANLRVFDDMYDRNGHSVGQREREDLEMKEGATGPGHPQGQVSMDMPENFLSADESKRPTVYSGMSPYLNMPNPTPRPSLPSDGHAKGGFIKGAIKHPGRETARAKAAGRSVHEQMEHDKGSKDPSLRGAANLGLRLTGGDLKPKRKG